MSVVQYVCSICRDGIVIFYVAEVLLVSCGYRSTELSYVGMFTRVAFKLIYRVSREECARLREGVPHVKVYRYNPKHLCPKLNGY